MLPEPDDILVIGLVHSLDIHVLDGWRRARVPPPMDFRVAVREGKPAGFVVITSGKIGQHRLRRIRITTHIHDEETVVDAVRVLIDQNPGHGGSRIDEVGQFEIFPKIPVANFVTKPSINPLVHSHPRIH